uniref:GH18 domain-containing protein n=1 Tax=Balaenoptera musculus TaxID=9771 RepID=A0A8C0CXI4_BALMU
MTYDFHHGWDTSTRHNSPLRVGSKDQGDICSFNCEYAMKPWRDNGVPSEKLIMGFLTYGRTFWLTGSSGPYTGEDGFWTYYEICTFLSEVTNAWIEDQKVPYAYKNPEGVGYDNIKSYGYKNLGSFHRTTLSVHLYRILVRRKVVNMEEKGAVWCSG